jgi:ParB family transcriptional regulator, chromosome partitioning protein
MSDKKTTSVDMGAKDKKPKKTGLGKGLDALFPEIELSPQSPAGNFLECDVDKIIPNPFQPRRQFPEAEMAELADSIKAQGILQPLLVRESGGKYELIAGERRLRAAKLAGLFKVPVMVKEIKDAELLELSIIENIQRQDLNPIEEAEAYQQLLTEFKLTQEQVAKRVGKSRPAIANFLRLNQLPQEIKSCLKDGTLTTGHARALLGLTTAALQRKVGKLVVDKGLSVRETERLVQGLNADAAQKKAAGTSQDDIYFKSVSEDLSRYFGTKVLIKRKGQQGKLEIEFYSDDDLDRLLGLLKSS